MTRTEYDRRHYARMKADPVKWAALLERKRKQRARRQATDGYETLRKRRWRAANPEHAQRIRRANHAVESALKYGVLVRPDACSNCGALGKIEAHHHKGYTPEYRLDVQWLCVFCHRKADKNVVL